MGDLTTLYGSGDIEVLFPDGRSIALTPWPRASRRKDRPSWDQAVLGAHLSRPPTEGDVAAIDPRSPELRATQPSVTRAGVAYYLDPPCFETYADRVSVGNLFLVVFDRGDGQRLILSGHHRFTAALLMGCAVHAHVMYGEVGSALFVWPGLWVGAQSAAALIEQRFGRPVRWVADPGEAFGIIRSSGTAVVATVDVAAEVLRSSGADPAGVGFRIAYLTGSSPQSVGWESPRDLSPAT